MKKIIFLVFLTLAIFGYSAWRYFQPSLTAGGIRRSAVGSPLDPRVAKVQQVVDALHANHVSGKVPARTYQLTEEDLNAYLATQLYQQQRKDVENLSVRLKEGTFVTHLVVNMDEVELKGGSMTANFLKALLSGRQRLEVEGELLAEKGVGVYRVLKALINDDPVLVPLVNAVFSAIGRNQDLPFDPTEPFDLPFGIKTVRVEPSKVMITT